jgi:hypothetical protein
MKRNILLYVIGGMAGCFAMGYVLGREHAEYAVKKALNGSKFNLRARASDAIDNVVDEVRERVRF